MLHAGLDLSRKKLDICLLSDEGEHLDQLAVAPDVDSLRRLARRIDEVHAEPVSAVVESMTGARIVHDTLEAEGWSVEIADAQKVKGLAPLACKTDKIDSLVLATLSRRDLVPAIWLPDPEIREERELAGFRLHLVKHKTALKNRVHSTLMSFGRACPVTDLFGAEGRRLLERLEVPEPWRSNVTASVWLIDELERHIDEINRRLREGHADHPYVPLLLSVPGSAGCWPSRSPPRSARSSASHRPKGSSATPGSARRAVRRLRPARPAEQARAPLPALGADRGDPHALPTPPTPSATSATRSGSASSAGRGSPRSTSPAGSHTRSGTCLPATRSSLPEAPRFVWRPDRPFGLAPASEHPISPDPPTEEAIET